MARRTENRPKNEDKVDGYHSNCYNLAVNEIARHGYAFHTESILNGFEKEKMQKLLNGKETHKRDEISVERPCLHGICRYR